MQKKTNNNYQYVPEGAFLNANNNIATTNIPNMSNNATGLTLTPDGTGILTQSFIYNNAQLNMDEQTFKLLKQQQQQQQQQQLATLTADNQGIYQPNPSTLYGQNLLIDQIQTMKLSGNTEIFDPTATAHSILHNTYVPKTAQEERLMQIIQAKEMKIQEMQGALQMKDMEIAELKSHLDKFQSVFPFSRSGATTPSGTVSSPLKTGNSFQRQRAQGISAEPQSDSLVLLKNFVFPKYDKNERL